MRPEIVAFSLTKLLMTTSRHLDWFVVDNHWPVDKYKSSLTLERVARLVNGMVIRPSQNLGGHGGFNYALSHMRLTEEDLILGYDPDSNPITPEWLDAMVHVMTHKPILNYVSLMHEHIVERPWEISDVKGIKIAQLPRPEMANVTLWRGRALLEGGIKASRKYYGFVETEMWKDGRSAYLYDYREDLCPIPHDPLYNAWKGAHAGGSYPGNFDEYYEEHRAK